MGKDGCGEPASKKFKQSQLCFQSPKSSGNLKSKAASPITNRSVCRSQNIHSSDAKDNLEVESKVLCNGDGSHIVSTEKSASSLDKTSSPLDNKENVSSCSNTPEAPVKESSSSDKITKENNNDECIAMDVDSSPSDVISSKTPELEPSVESKCDKTNDIDMIVNEPSKNQEDPSSSEPQSINESSKEGSSETVPDEITPSKGDKSSLTDVSVMSANESLSLSKSDVIISSDSEDDGGNTSSSSTPVTPKTPKRQMTPKMLKRFEESVKKKQLQQQLKAEKRAKREEMKNERMKMKTEEEEKKKQMKEERKKKRLAELELKNEEKRLKQEDKKQKREKEEEEKRLKKEQRAEEMRKEEEKKELEEKKKERVQAAFVSFFKKQPSSGVTSGTSTTSTSNDTSTVSSESPAFMPFPMKNDMRLAASVRRQLSETERQGLESVLKGEGETSTYLQVLKDNSYTPRSCSATWVAPVSDELHDCIIIEAQVEDQESANQPAKSSEEVPDSSKLTKTTRRAKLLQFCENRRPAYFGTWTKNSKQVSGRTPFARDNKGALDYEVDSDSEWEEEEEGEDLESVKDDDNEGQEEELEEGENGYLLDNTFVPHGYLSDEEHPDEEDIHESVEQQKDRLVALKEEFDEEMKQGGAQALKPKLLGCLWVSNSTTQVSKGSLYEVLLAHRAVWDESSCPGGIDMEPDLTPCNEKSPTQTPSSKQLPVIVLQEIAQMVDGSRWPLNKLVREVGEVLAVARPQNPVSRLALTKAIKQMASKTLDSKENSVWTIKAEYRSEYKLQDLEEIQIPLQVTPTSRVKNKETLLDNFLRGGHQQKSAEGLGAPAAKKRISLTPVLSTPPVSVNKTEVTPDQKKLPEVTITKKKVAFVTLPPRTPGSTPQNRSLPRTPGSWPSSEGKQSTLKPHVDTPRPPVNRFLKTSPATVSEPIEISDDSNL